MSIHVINLVMQRFPGKGNEYGVMLSLAENAHDDGSNIYPSLDEIARKARVSRNTARRMRDRLVEKGWLSLEYQGGNGPRDPNRYRMDVDRLQACPRWEVESQNKGTNLDPLPDAKGTTQVGPIKSTNLRPLDDAKGTKSGSKGTKALVPEPSLEPSEDQEQEQDRADALAAAPEIASRETQKHPPPETTFETPGQWANWFHRAHDFSQGKACQPKAYVMYRDWIARGITVGQVLEGMEVAEARKGGRPATPAFYGWAVNELLAAVEKGETAGMSAQALPWDRTATGITQRGAQLQVFQEEGEPFPVFKARVMAADESAIGEVVDEVDE